MKQTAHGGPIIAANALASAEALWPDASSSAPTTSPAADELPLAATPPSCAEPHALAAVKPNACSASKPTSAVPAG
eukprot:CAMPEP_0181175496 /NCGR_PEP_ID=MMETSP1096-20121128/4109_1 /TAXON_ID=156174 ORGANISM="Chrysochromulina ericina, Strain CCMP281" /NCGR_SAMPLE_ID=MMETSP1096 /ASSEMBLY_ACC=CAM_ASM_000453 /LENGTH=75 /DNA_ID=CAMNT_0023263485 /DNA_START=151 /DNA_END=374 /DNA_ORIENTATION=+